MKKIIASILLMCMVLSLSACGKVEITMQEIYDANQAEALLQNHQSVCIRDEMDGKIWVEKYLTKEYAYSHYLDEESDSAQFMTDDTSYSYSNGDYLRYLFIAPDGVTNDFTSDRAEYYMYLFNADSVDETIESATKKDGCITVNSILGQDAIAEMAEYGVTSYKNEYMLDEKNHELISIIGNCTYDDDVVERSVTKFEYDAEAPEMLKVFMKYANQTEDLRNVTVISNPGTEKEVSQEFQIPKGLIIGLTWDDAFEDKVEFYTDAACTEAYDPYVNADSDLTIYVKWAE